MKPLFLDSLSTVDFSSTIPIVIVKPLLLGLWDVLFGLSTFDLDFSAVVFGLWAVFLARGPSLPLLLVYGLFLKVYRPSVWVFRTLCLAYGLLCWAYGLLFYSYG